MKYLLGLVMLFAYGITTNAQNVYNNTNCPITVSVICYTPGAPCPAMPSTPGNTMVTFQDPPGPAHSYTVLATAIVPASPTPGSPGTHFFPPMGPCAPGDIMAYMICNDNSVVPWCVSNDPPLPAPTYSTCGIIEVNPTGSSCYSNHGYLPSDCPGCEFHPGTGHVCVCFDPSGDLILGF